MIDLDTIDRATLAQLLRAAADRLDPPPAPEPDGDDLGEMLELPAAAALIDVASAAERFGRCQRQIRRLCKAGAGERVGGRWQVDPVKLRQMIR